MPVRLSSAYAKPEVLLLEQLHYTTLPQPVQQFVACPPRKHAWDLAWPDQRLLVDVQGGVHAGGRHVRGYGYELDTEKWNLAVVAGYTILIVTTRQVETGAALRWIDAVLTCSTTRSSSPSSNRSAISTLTRSTNSRAS